MSKASASPEGARTQVRFSIEFDEKPDREIQLVACAFDRAGRLLSSCPVKEGQALLTLPPAAAATARVFFAPVERTGKPKELTLADMERLRAHQPAWIFDPKQEHYKLLPIPRAWWTWWLFCRCHVRGRVVKHAQMADVLVDRPVSGARVHICEVDKFWWILRRLPDYRIFKLRDDLLDLLKRPPLPDPPPEMDVQWPPPPPGPDPVILGPAYQAGKLSGLNWLNPQPEPPLPVRKTINLKPSLDASGLQTSAVAVPVDLAPTVRLALNSNSSAIVREALIDQVHLILPLLCHFPWLLPFLTCDELAVVDTNTDGRFEADIWYRCAGDKPDLYFWVEYFLEGSWQTVYKPNKRCHTWWNYPCGTEVTIHITDPRVPACDSSEDLPGLQVVIAAIGNGVSFQEIIPPGPAWNLSGDAGMVLNDGALPKKPFAGSLELRLDMSRSNLIALGITHYRWSYRRVVKADGTADTDTWHPMTRDVYRYYKVQVPDPTVPGGWRPTYPADRLGMDPAIPGEYLTRIQPPLTPAGDYNWTPLNEHVDLAWAYFDTADLVEPETAGTTSPAPVAGKYELKLELFKLSGTTATSVNWSHPTGPGSSPIHVFVANNVAPFVPPTGMTVAPAGPDHLLKDGSGHTVGFRMVVHVDNRPCGAAIDDVAVQTPGDPDDHGGPCGFIRFPNPLTSLAKIGFRARHPDHHADFYFRVDKGSVGPVGAASAGWVPSPISGDPDHGVVVWAWTGAAVNGFARDASSHFVKLVPVGTLLNSHVICPEAAFAETIYVAARATDGYQRASWLDASATPKAFALAPKAGS